MSIASLLLLMVPCTPGPVTGVTNWHAPVLQADPSPSTVEGYRVYYDLQDGQGWQLGADYPLVCTSDPETGDTLWCGFGIINYARAVQQIVDLACAGVGDAQCWPALMPTNSTPVPSLGVFAGTGSAGSWRLFVYDDASYDGGALDSWGLSFDGGVTWLVMPDNIAIPDSGQAAPYPSTLDVLDGPTSVGSIMVQLYGATHTWPDDLDIVLVGPTGATAILMSDAGGDVDVAGLTLTFDDAAPASPPDWMQLQSASYRPVDYEPGDPPPGLPPVSDTLTALEIRFQLTAYDDRQDDGDIYFGESLPTNTITICYPPWWPPRQP